MSTSVINGQEGFSRRRSDPLSPDFKRHQFPLYWVARLSGLYSLRMDALLKKIGMDVPRWRVLGVLTEKNPSSISEIAEEAVIRLSTTTKLVQRMKEEGLVDTRPSATDGRVTEVRITDAGRAAFEKVRARAGQVFEQSCENIDDASLAQLNDVLRAMFHNLQRDRF